MLHRAPTSAQPALPPTAERTTKRVHDDHFYKMPLMTRRRIKTNLPWKDLVRNRQRRFRRGEDWARTEIEVDVEVQVRIHLGIIWGSSGIIWNHLGSSGFIWGHPKSSWVIWGRLEPLRSSAVVWGGRFAFVDAICCVLTKRCKMHGMHHEIEGNYMNPSFFATVNLKSSDYS
jgi:hypothetical protein